MILETIILASTGCSSNQVARPSEHRFSTAGRTSDETSLSLVWELNLGSGTLTDRTQVRPSRASSPVGATFLLLGQAGAFDIAAHDARQAGAEGRKVGASIPLGDVVGEAQHGLVVAVVPPQGQVQLDPVLTPRMTMTSFRIGVLDLSR